LRANCYRKRPLSGTGRRSSEQAFDAPDSSEVIVAPGGSGYGDNGGVGCSATWTDDDEDSDCSSESRSSGDVVPSPRRLRPSVDDPRTRTARLENVVVVNAPRENDDDDDLMYWMTSLSPSTQRRWSTMPTVRHWPAASTNRVMAVRTQAPPYLVDVPPTTTAGRRAAAVGERATRAPAAADVRRRPGSVSGGSSLGLNIGLIVGIAAGVVVLFLALGYAVNRYRRCRGGGADHGSYRLAAAAVGGDSCCRYDGLKLISTQHPPPPPPLGLHSAPRGCYGGASATSLGKAGVCKVPSKEWYV